MLLLADTVQVSTGAVGLVVAIPTLAWIFVQFGDRLWKSEAPAPEVHQNVSCKYDFESMRETMVSMVGAQQHMAESVNQLVTALTVHFKVQEMRHSELTKQLDQANERLTRSPGGIVRT